MHKLLFLAGVLLFAGSLCARAQLVEAYGTFNITRMSNVATGVAATPNGYQTQFTSITPICIGGGLSFRVLSLPFASVALDARGSARSGAQDNAMFGLKLGVKLPHLKYKPYLEGAAGYLTTHTANVSPAASGEATSDDRITTHYAVYEFLGGVDYAFKTNLDIRLIEVGGGSSFGYSPNASLFTINSGVVLHF